MIGSATTHVDPGDLIVLSHEAPHEIVSTAWVNAWGHHVAVDAAGWHIALDDDGSLPSWCVCKREVPS